MVEIEAGKAHKLNFFVAKDGPFGALFLTPKSRPKSLCGSLWRSFPGNEAHQLFPGVRGLGVLGWGPKVIEKVVCSFLSPAGIISPADQLVRKENYHKMHYSRVQQIRIASLDGRKRAFSKRTRACRNAHFNNASSSGAALVDSVSVRFENAHVER